MRKREAIDLLKEIGVSCRLLNPNAIVLKQTAEDGSYEIHFSADINDECWECLKILAKRHGLGLKQKDDSLVVYEFLNKKYGQLVFA